MGKMRLLEVVSAALACTSAAIIFSALSGSGDRSLLNLAGICCLVIAVYQAVNFYFGYTLQPKRHQNQVQKDRAREQRTEDLTPALDGYNDETIIEMPTVTESTTELLRPKKRRIGTEGIDTNYLSLGAPERSRRRKIASANASVATSLLLRVTGRSLGRRTGGRVLTDSGT
jgi:hypothetical protein